MYLLSLFAPKQKSIKRIVSNDVKTLLADFDEIKLSDSSYKLVDIERLKKFLKYNNTDRRVYKKIKHDCDDFSYILQGDVTRWDSDLAFGIAWVHKPNGVYHAMNVCITTDYEVVLIEPQTDRIISVLVGWVLKFVMM